MLNYVIYSHTDYLDVLKIQTDYLETENRYLLINKCDCPEIFAKYKKVIFYDENLSYPSRMLALKELSEELDYMCFFHEKDIVMYKNDEIMEKILSNMIRFKIDRVDMRYDTSEEAATNPKLLIHNDDLFISKQLVGCYAFCITPSIWKLSSYIKLMETFQHSTYRRIEIDAQNFAKNNFSLYRSLSDKRINCGLIECTEYFQYLPSTHYFKFIPKDAETLSQRMDSHLIEKWHKIIKDYNLEESDRGFNTTYDVHIPIE